MSRLRRDVFKLGAEQKAGPHEGDGPQQSPKSVVEQEPLHAHAKEAGQCRCNRAQARNELGHDERTDAVPREEVLGPPNAGIRLQ